MSAQVASLQLNVEHLKKQSEMDRIKVSEASKEYVDHNEECIHCEYVESSILLCTFSCGVK